MDPDVVFDLPLFLQLFQRFVQPFIQPADKIDADVFRLRGFQGKTDVFLQVGRRIDHQQMHMIADRFVPGDDVVADRKAGDHDPVFRKAFLQIVFIDLVRRNEGRIGFLVFPDFRRIHQIDYADVKGNSQLLFPDQIGYRPGKHAMNGKDEIRPECLDLPQQVLADPEVHLRMDEQREVFGDPLTQEIDVWRLGRQRNVGILHQHSHLSHQRKNVQLSGFIASVFQFLLDRVRRSAVTEAGLYRCQDQHLFHIQYSNP